MSPYRIEKDVQPGFDRLSYEAGDDRCAVLIKRQGGEVVGYRVHDPKRGRDLPLLWNDGRDEPPSPGAWKNHATILFPIVGGLRNGESRCGGTPIRLGSHGLARRLPFTLASAEVSDQEATLIYRLRSDATTRQSYPYDFTLDLIYRLHQTSLSLTFAVTNDGTTPMHFQCGWHPGFSTELGLGGKRQDWQLQFRRGHYERIHCQDDGTSFLTGKTSPLEFEGTLAYSDHDLACTVFLKVDAPENRACRFINRKLGCGIELSFPDFSYLAVWGDKGYEYVCIEPCQGLDDHAEQEPFEKKRGMVRLDPQETSVRRATVRPLLTL